MVEWNNTALFSKGSDEWRTPRWLFNRLDQIYHFDLDVACTRENCLSRNGYGYTKEDDALKCDWHRFVMGNGEDAITFFLNPPHSLGKQFIEKAHHECIDNKMTGVLLIPARTDTEIWHRCIFSDATEIQFIKGRLRFDPPYVGAKTTCAPFPSAVVVFTAGPSLCRPRITTLIQECAT